MQNYKCKMKTLTSFQHVSNLGKGAGPMADAVLLFWRELGQGLAELGNEEDRIVPEPVLPGRRVGDHAF